jgi:hypothetical protein
MTKRPRYALSRQMHHFAELDSVLRELRGKAELHPHGKVVEDNGLANLAWHEALRRRMARLLETGQRQAA